MHTQRQLLELARERQASSFTELAKQLGVSRQALSQFRLGMPLSSEIALKIADMTGLAPAYVFACVEYQRAQRLERTETLPIWQEIAEHFAKHPSAAATRMPPKRKPGHA